MITSIKKLVSKATALTYNKDVNAYIGSCPICHAPMLSVDEQKGTFMCYACGISGEAQDFNRLLGGGGRTTVPEKDAELVNINNAAAWFFYNTLIKDENIGFSYFSNRGIDRDTIDSFGLGYAPDNYKELYDYLKEQFSDEALLKSGIIKKSEKGFCYPFFRNRVMFPILDFEGDVIGFGGRVLTDEKPKYINSAENSAFSKGTILYGYPYNLEERSNEIIICEGYMDLIAMQSHQIADSAAVLGTALTQEHITLIKQHYKKVVLALDTDAAGTNAMMRSMDTLKKNGIEVVVPSFAPAKDPDEFIKRFGKEEFKNRIKESLTSECFIARNSGVSKLLTILTGRA